MQNKELLQTIQDHIKHYMHLSTTEPHVITDDVSCVLVDYCSIADESILLWGFKQRIFYWIKIQSYLEQACKKRSLMLITFRISNDSRALLWCLEHFIVKCYAFAKATGPVIHWSLDPFIILMHWRDLWTADIKSCEFKSDMREHV